MSIELYASNDLESLADQLSVNLKEDRFDVFSKPFIVTQTEGINSWLKIQLAEKMGIVSNVALLSPTDVISQVFSALGGGFQQSMHSEHLKWLLFGLMGETDFATSFPKISNYFGNSESKRLSLAQKTADLFDQYQIYRPEKITQWSNGALETAEDLQWQSYLWHKVKSKYGEQLSDKTEMANKIMALLSEEKNQQALVNRIPRLYFFGIAIITPFYLKLFHSISRYIPVRFYLINPSPETYWMDDVTEKRMIFLLNRNKTKTTADFTIGNELLLNWGKIIKDSFSLLFNDEETINAYNDSLRKPIEHPVTLLQKVQSDIYNNAAQDSRHEISESDISDGSVTINASFTSYREVELLYNYIIQLIDEKKTSLSPRDIVVMVNDVDKYAPFINAVFDNAPYKIPFSIADESVSSGNNFFSALELIMSMEENKFTSERVLELLENKYIRSRFGISNLPLIRRTMAEANIISGIIGSTENDTRYMSWEYGLRKIMLGLCLSGEDSFEYKREAIQPIDNIEGDNSFELIKFYHFTTVLLDYIKERSAKRNLEAWIEYLKTLAEDMVFESANGEDDDFHVFLKQLEKIETAATFISGEIEFDTFRMAFKEKLSYEKRTHSFLRGGITFCSFIPMRSIPFKVICLLGLDFDKFPRKENPLSFSLFNKDFLKGDRNVKDNDKHLFLETILSAKEFLYMSYVGSNIKDGKAIPPSALLDEFIDYVGKGVEGDQENIRKKMVTHHPLHGFSQKYGNEQRFVSYLSYESYKTTDNVPEKTSAPEPFDFSEIDIKDLASFFKNPVDFYFNKTLRIYYQTENLLLPENELFKIDNPSFFMIDWIKQPHNNLTEFAKEKMKKGEVPLHNFGLANAEYTVNGIMEMKEALLTLTKNKEEAKLSGYVDLSGSSVSGFINNVYDGKIVTFSVSSKIFKGYIQNKVSFVFARACGHNVDWIHAYHCNGLKTIVHSAADLSTEEAKTILAEWVSMYKKGCEGKFHFYPNFKNPLEAVSKDWSYFITMAKNEFENEFKKQYDDLYYKNARANGFFNDVNFESFKENTLKLLGDVNLIQ